MPKRRLPQRIKTHASKSFFFQLIFLVALTLLFGSLGIGVWHFYQSFYENKLISKSENCESPSVEQQAKTIQKQQTARETTLKMVEKDTQLKDTFPTSSDKADPQENSILVDIYQRQKEMKPA